MSLTADPTAFGPTTKASTAIRLIDGTVILTQASFYDVNDRMAEAATVTILDLDNHLMTIPVSSILFAREVKP